MAMYVEMASPQFENVNALRMFPFANGSSLVDRNGKELPKDVISDLHLFVPGGVTQPESGDMDNTVLPEVKMSSVHLSRSMVSACFVSGSGSSVNALSVTVSADEFKPYFPYRLEKLYGTSDMGGIVTFGAVDFPFHPETYFLDAAVVHPCCMAVSKPAALRKFIDRRSGEEVSGDVEIVFSGYVASAKTGKNFELSLEEGAEVELASECSAASSSSVCGATPISSINGISPDEDGNIVLWFH